MTEYVNKEYYSSIKGNCAYIDLNGENIHKVMISFVQRALCFQPHTEATEIPLP